MWFLKLLRMATKKRRSSAPRKRSRRKKTMSQNLPLARRRKSSHRRRKKKTGLSEIFTHQTFKNAGMSSGSGAMGGLVSYGLDRVLPDGKPGLRAIVQLGSAFLLAGGLDKPYMGAGLMGAYSNNLANEFTSKSMSEMENTDYADDDSLDKYPDALDEDGNAMYLADDGNFYYLDEFELADDGEFQLSQTMQAELYPGYVNPNM